MLSKNVSTLQFIMSRETTILNFLDPITMQLTHFFIFTRIHLNVNVHLYFGTSLFEKKILNYEQER